MNRPRHPVAAGGRRSWLHAAMVGLVAIASATCGKDTVDGNVPQSNVAADLPTRLVVTLGLQGNLEPCGCGGNNSGGLGSLIDVVAAQREAGAREGFVVHTVEGGASFGGGPLTALARDALLSSWRSQGYDAVCLGDDELAAWPEPWQAAPPAELLVVGHPTRSGTVASRSLGSFALTSIVAGQDVPGAIAGLRRFVADSRARSLAPVVMLHARGKPRMQLLRALSSIDTPYVAFDVQWDGSSGGVARYGAGQVVRVARNGKAVALVDGIHGDAKEPRIKLLAMPTTASRTQHSLEAPAAKVAVATDAPFAGHVGSKRCGECHPTQHARWASTRHAVAMETLERKDVHRRADCFVCHITANLPAANAVAIELPASVPDAFRGVGCESCHGPGAQHVAERKPMTQDPLQSCATCHVPKFSGEFDAARALARATCQGTPMTPAERDAKPDILWANQGHAGGSPK